MIDEKHLLAQRVRNNIYRALLEVAANTRTDESGCPNVLPGAKCIDPDCAYCRIAQAERPIV